MEFQLQGVSLDEIAYKGREAIRITMPSSANQDPTREALTDRDFMAWQRLDFCDGTIEVDVASVLSPYAPAYARGFIGLTFRIDDNNRFESIYLRPANSRVDDQVRRNRTVQYVAYPDFPFPRLRNEEPGRYETYADIDLDEWIRMRVDVKGTEARLYLNDAPRPALIVTDMKLGAQQRGGVGCWVEAGTIGYFSGLRVAPAT